jgi:hypothetical protein
MGVNVYPVDIMPVIGGIPTGGLGGNDMIFPAGFLILPYKWQKYHYYI